jgi:hypothetical protein
MVGGRQRLLVRQSILTITRAGELPGSQHGFMIDVEATRTALLRTEDTNGDDHITADDVGSKVRSPIRSQFIALT